MVSFAVMSVGVSLVVPVYNERDNLEAAVERSKAVLEELGRAWELILVDDGSDDGSDELLDRLAGADERLMVLHFERNCGQTAALDAGFTSSRGDLVAILDADLQTFPEDLPELIRTLESADVAAVVGVRAERHDSPWKRFSSWFANGVRNRLTSEDIVDTGCPLKVFRGDAIRAVTLYDGMHRFLPTLLKLDGHRVVQVPVRHAERRAGQSKYGTWDRAWRGFVDALAVRWMQRRTLRWRLR